MLVLTRKKYEAAILVTPGGEKIVVSVTGIRGDKVQIGFEAPAKISIDREEVYLAKLEASENGTNNL